MPTRPAAHRLLLTALILLGAAAPAAAQRTRDQARLIFSVSPAYTLGSSLWSVARQPVIASTSAIDTFAIQRDIRPSLGLGFQGVYYPNGNLGFSAEGLLIGLGFRDNCRLIHDSGNQRLANACTSINGFEKSASAVVLSVGAVFRVNSQKTISPYVRAQAGAVFANQSAIRTIGNVAPPDSEEVDLIIYPDVHNSRVTAALGLGLGMSAVLGPGYQIHWEVRDNLVGVPEITGPTEVDGLRPPQRIAYKHLVSFSIGFDLVLERRRGRRY